MSLSSETTRLSVTLTAAAQEVPVPFYFVQTSDLKVVTSNGVTLVEGTDYSVAGAGNSAGGSITTIPTVGNGLVIGSKLAIIRDGPLDQQTSLTNNGGFPSTTIERALDKIVTLIQQVAEVAGRAIRIPEYEEGSSDLALPLKTARANKFVGFDSAGDLVMKDASTLDGSITIESDLIASVNVTKPGSGDGATVIFDVINAPSVVLTAGKWSLTGGVTARTSNGNDTIYARFYNNDDGLAFGGGPAHFQAQLRTALPVAGTITVPTGETRRIYFVVGSYNATLDVGAAPDGPAGYILATALPL